MVLAILLVIFVIAATKYPNKSKLKNEMVCLGSRLEDTVSQDGKSWQEESEGAEHIVYGVGKQRVTFESRLLFSFYEDWPQA